MYDTTQPIWAEWNFPLSSNRREIERQIQKITEIEDLTRVLELLNELGKRDKTRGWPTILFLFRNEFIDKFNNTGARMLDYIYHEFNFFFGVKR